jgi:hypothetical protein
MRIEAQRQRIDWIKDLRAMPGIQKSIRTISSPVPVRWLAFG